MKKRASKIIAAAGITLAYGLAGLHADTKTDPLIAGCAVCHGENGISPREKGIPSIARMSEKSFIAAMTEFRTGAREGTIMTRLVKGLTDDEIKALARFYAKGNQ